MQVPSGVTLINNGTISGNIITAGGEMTGKSPSEGVTPAPVISTASLPGGRINVPYSARVAATFNEPFTWLIAYSEFPGNLEIDGNTGILSGTPTAAGTYRVRVKAKVSDSIASTKTFYVTIGVPGSGASFTGGVSNESSRYAQKSAPYLDANGNLVLSIDADFAGFVSVSVDSVPVERADCDVKGGSTVVTLHRAYLTSLKDGVHTVRVQFKYGYYTGTFTTPLAISTTAIAEVPATGGVPLVWGLLCAAPGLFALIRRKRG